jgi:hypothetical protein
MDDGVLIPVRKETTVYNYELLLDFSTCGTAATQNHLLTPEIAASGRCLNLYSA